MELFFTFVHPFLMFVLVGLLLVGLMIKQFWPMRTVYRYGLTQQLIQKGAGHNGWRTPVLVTCRLLALLFLICAASRPQRADQRSQIVVDGIDIVLVLDVSGSMQFVDDQKNQQLSRLDIAKKEATRFINKRDRDAIGLVIFGNDAVSRCPVTYDKTIAKDIINQLSIGVIDPQGTMLSRGLLTGINRLRRSKAKSKILILLTDGEPTPGDIDPTVAMRAAQQCGVKVYTIGIGSEHEEYLMHPLYGMIPKPKINKELLTKIAEQTGGRFFLARDARDMAAIYDTIDSLEKTEHEVPQFARYQDFFMPLLCAACMCIMSELFLAGTIWFGL